MSGLIEFFFCLGWILLLFAIIFVAFLLNKRKYEEKNQSQLASKFNRLNTESTILKDSLERLRSIFDGVYSGIVILDKNLNIETVNQGFLTETQFPFGKIIGKPFLHFVQDSRENLDKNDFNQVIKEKKSLQFRHKLPTYQRGKIIVDSRMDPLIIEGKISGAIVLIDFVHDAVIAEKQIQEMNQTLFAIVESVPDPLVTTNREHKITYWNKAAQNLTGFRDSDILGTFGEELIFAGVKKFPEFWQEIKDSDQPILGRLCSIQNRNGNNIAVLLSASAVESPTGGFAGGVAIFTDISERLELENKLTRSHSELSLANKELQTVAKHRSDFLSNMSHELRTPLNSIIGFSGILLEGVVGELNLEQSKQLKNGLQTG